MKIAVESRRKVVVIIEAIQGIGTLFLEESVKTNDNDTISCIQSHMGEIPIITSVKRQKVSFFHS
jgi:hypothetical protein